MNSISSIALSGLTFASNRLTRSAQNVANVNTNGYEARREVAREQQNGGVTSTSEPTYAPHPTYDLTGEEVLGSNTDLVSETVEQLGAAQQFKASLKLLQTDQELTKSLLNIKA